MPKKKLDNSELAEAIHKHLSRMNGHESGREDGVGVWDRPSAWVHKNGVMVCYRFNYNEHLLTPDLARSYLDHLDKGGGLEYWLLGCVKKASAKRKKL